MGAVCMKALEGRHTPLRRALWVVVAYLVAGILWIIFSDWLVEAWFADPATLSRVQTFKGFLFILLTAAVLFVSVLRQLHKDRELLELQHHQRERIQALNQFRESVIDNANVWMNALDPEGRVTLWNRAAESISGYSREEVVGRDEIWQWLYPEADERQAIKGRAGEILQQGTEVVGFETWITTRQGDRRLISWNSRGFRDDEGKLLGSIAIGQDVTDARLAEQALSRRERQLATLMDNLPGMAYRCHYDDYWTMEFVSSGCRELTGYAPGDLIHNQLVSYADLLENTDNESLTHAVEMAIGQAEPFSLEYQIKRRDGRIIWVWERGRAVAEDGGLMLEGIVLDISDRKVLEQELARMATRDPLTGLYNRREMSRVLEEELARASRYERSLALLWIDFDHFKFINDHYGHAAGDQVLQSVSQLLLNSIRSVDAIGRFGGEEFLILLPEMDLAEARDTGERLRRLVQESPLPLGDGQTTSLTISIGVAGFPDHGTTAREVCAAADRAMYHAKEGGRNRVVLAPLTAEAHEWEL